MSFAVVWRVVGERDWGSGHCESERGHLLRQLTKSCVCYICFARPQIRIFELPTQFDNALQTTITTKQNITATKKYVVCDCMHHHSCKPPIHTSTSDTTTSLLSPRLMHTPQDNVLVSLATNEIIARKDANVTGASTPQPRPPLTRH